MLVVPLAVVSITALHAQEGKCQGTYAKGPAVTPLTPCAPQTASRTTTSANCRLPSVATTKSDSILRSRAVGLEA